MNDKPDKSLAQTEQIPSQFQPEMDWRITFGAAVTGIYLFLMALYISSTVGWIDFQKLPVEDMGNFLEGAFAPVAFLWLVIGYFLQKKELMQNTQAMLMQFVEIQKSTEQAVLQSKAIAATEMHQRKESFLRIADAVHEQLGSIVGFLFFSSQNAEGNEQRVPQDKLAEMWAAMGSGNREIFSREMMGLLLTSDDRYRFKLLWGTPLRSRHTENFIYTFERLYRTAKECDEEGMIADALMGGAHGHLFSRMTEIKQNPPQGFTIGVYDFDPDSRG